MTIRTWAAVAAVVLGVVACGGDDDGGDTVPPPCADGAVMCPAGYECRDLTGWSDLELDGWWCCGQSAVAERGYTQDTCAIRVECDPFGGMPRGGCPEGWLCAEESESSAYRCVEAP